MTPPIFCTPIDGFETALAADHAAGSAVLELVNAGRLGTPTGGAPVRLTICTAEDPEELLGQFLATARSGNLVTVQPDAGFANLAIPAGAVCKVAITSAELQQLHTVITTLAAEVTLLGSTAGTPGLDGQDGVAQATAPLSYNASTRTISLNASGSPSASTYLRGDFSWATLPAGQAPAVTSVAGRVGAITLAASDVGGLATVATTGAWIDLTGRPTLGTASARSDNYFALASHTHTAAQVGGLATVATSGQYSDLTGRPTISGSNTGDQLITLTGDVTGSGTGTFSTTLATVNTTVGTFTNATVTVDGKGRVIAIASGSGGGGSTPPAGPTGAVQLNAGGSLGGSAGFTFNSTTSRVSIGTGTTFVIGPDGGYPGAVDLSAYDSSANDCRALRVGAIIPGTNNFVGALFQLFPNSTPVYGGQLYFDSGTVGSAGILFRTDGGQAARLVIANNGPTTLSGQAPGQPVVRFQGVSGQSADLVQCLDSAGNSLSGVSATGYFRSRKGSGPPADSPPDGSQYLDETNRVAYWRIAGGWWKTALTLA